MEPDALTVAAVQAVNHRLWWCGVSTHSAKERRIELRKGERERMDTMELDIASTVVGEQQIISVKGEIDLYSSTMLREYIFTTLKHQPRALIVDLDAVRYIDSSGIATMVEALQRANKSKTQFKVAGLSKNVLEVFELVKLEKVFEIYDSVEAALRSADERS